MFKVGVKLPQINDIMEQLEEFRFGFYHHTSPPPRRNSVNDNPTQRLPQLLTHNLNKKLEQLIRALNGINRKEGLQIILREL